jgi:hypothetical protein
MNNKGKWKSFSDKINNFSQADAHIGIRVEQASHLRLSVSTLTTTVKNCETTERTYVQCGTFCKQQKLLKHLPVKKLETALAAWFKQAYESNASIDGTNIKEKALHIPARVGTTNFLASNRWINRSDYRTLSGESRSADPETVEDWKNYGLLQKIEDCNLCERYIYIYICKANHTSHFFSL